MMSGAKKMVPKRRFKEFLNAGDWEQRKLGDFTNQINTFVNPEDAKLPLWSLTAEAGLIEKSDRYERDFLVKKKDQFKRIETNTLVYNPMNITIGSIDIYTGLYPIAVSGYYVSIVYDKNIDTDFLKEVLLLPSSLKMYKNYATGSLIERQRVQYPTFSKLQLLLPNLDEQKAIGQFFKSLNLDITLHQRKLDKLQATKKALLQEMFPEEGQDKPKRRFKGFTDAWEQCKLGSIGSTYTGLSGKTKEDFGHGEAQYITYLNVFQNTVSDITMTDKVEIDTTQNEVKYGDVLFTTSSETPEEVGMSSVWLGHMPNIYLNSFCFGFRPNQKIDPYFLGYSLRAPYMRDKMKILAQGISRYNISKNKVMELEISLPNNEEQRLLGNFLRNIDLSITLHQRKLDKLKNLKQAYLNEMFV